MGKRDERLDAVIVPDGVEYVWSIFWDIYKGAAFDWSEIESYARLTGWTVEPFEIELLKGMASEALEYQAKAIKEDTKGAADA